MLDEGPAGGAGTLVLPAPRHQALALHHLQLGAGAVGHAGLGAVHEAVLPVAQGGFVQRLVQLNGHAGTDVAGEECQEEKADQLGPAKIHPTRHAVCGSAPVARI